MRRAATHVLLLLVIAAPAALAQFDDPHLQTETIVSGLTNPTGMAFIGADDFLVLQKSDGRVLRVTGDVLQPGEVLDLQVHNRSERGLLGIATDPHFEHNSYVYIYYTPSVNGLDTASNVVEDRPVENRIERYTWNGSALVDPLPLHSFDIVSLGSHNGGVIRFGPDDRLYLIVGDSGTGDVDTSTPSQVQNDPDADDPNDLGVIYRVDTQFRPLADNPLYDASEPDAPAGRYLAYGIRNSFGLAIDPVSGDVWYTENGPFDYDELNHAAPGFNGGWYPMYGPEDRSAGEQSDLWLPDGAVYRDPEMSWLQPVAPTAIEFVGSRLLGCELEHDLLVGDYGCGQIYRFELDENRDRVVLESAPLLDRVADNPHPTKCSNEQDEIVYGPLGSFGQFTFMTNGPDGFLYLVLYRTHNPDLTLGPGSIVRVRPDPTAITDVDGDLVDDACDCSTADPTAFAAPREVPRVRVADAVATQLGWEPQTATAGSGTLGTVLSGTLGELQSDGGFARSCTLVSAPAAAADARVPPAGTGYYYLVRASNSCATGTVGDGSATPDARDALDAATPLQCM